MSEDAETDLEKARKIYNDNKGIVDYLQELLDSGNEELNKVVSRNYKLVYEAKNPFGVELRSTFFSRFNNEDELIAVKDDEEDGWTLLGNYFQIPGYYDRI